VSALDAIRQLGCVVVALAPKRWAAGAIGPAYLHTCKNGFNFTTILGCLPWRPWCDFIEPGFDGAEFRPIASVLREKEGE
jgi:hypothetical protein